MAIAGTRYWINKMMQLSVSTLEHVKPAPGLTIPDESLLALPERVLQFGTGVLLRGLPDYFIDKANRNGVFNGRIVVVKSTSSGGTDAFTEQGGLFTQVIRGIDQGKEVNEAVINSSISRVISASDAWADVLACAHNPEMELIISNTTEVGISLLPGDDISAVPPVSFPAKLLAFLHERYRAFNGSAHRGFVIVPTELIPDNGAKLREIVLTLAEQNGCDASFVAWIKEANHFCSSLVDRIVPGKLSGKDLEDTVSTLGYTDDLMIMSEAFRLWAIECTSPQAREVLSFSRTDEGVVLTDDLEKFRELKLRLLNGTHTLSCGLSLVSGFKTVREAMEDPSMGQFITRMAIEEIAPAIVSEKISYREACEFATSVFDRFRNPFLVHQWISIAAQYTSKMKMRVVPILVNHYRHATRPPLRIARGFAAFLLLLRLTKNEDGKYVGKLNGSPYTVQDDDAEVIASLWQKHSIDKIAAEALKKSEYWGMDLTTLPGFAEEVGRHLEILAGRTAPNEAGQNIPIREHI